VLVALAEIFRSHGPASRAPFGPQMRPRHRRAMPDIEHGRTEALGGQLDQGDSCRASPSSYHACKNRPGPPCQHAQAEPWLAHQPRWLLPVAHFRRTCTLPEARRAVARSHQQTIDTSLFRRSAGALQALAAAPRCIGGRVGMVGGLPTWTRALRYHPHGHDIVPGGGRATEHHWRPSRPDFLVPVKPRSGLFRATFRDELNKPDRFSRVEAPVWPKDCVVPCEPVDRGQEALRSLAPYLVRVAISHHRLLKLAAGAVTFHDKASAPDQGHTATVPAGEGLRRFLQPGLPDRCVNVRDDGRLSPSTRHRLTRARQWLGGRAGAPKTRGHGGAGKAPTAAPPCPWGGSTLSLVQTRRPTGR
jgi:hypothetical protein